MNRRFPPTAKRLRRARDAGDVAKGPEVTASCVCGVGLALLPIAYENMQQILESAHNFRSHSDLGGVVDSWRQLLEAAFAILCVILVILFFVGVAVEMLQVGWTVKYSSIKWERVSVSKGLCRLFGISGDGESFSILNTPLWECVRLLLLLAITLVSFPIAIKELLRSDDLPLTSLASLRVVALTSIPWFVAMSLVSLGFYSIALWQRRTRLKMTLEELKEEHRDSEGRAEIKQRRSEIFREISELNIQPRRPTIVVTSEGRR